LIRVPQIGDDEPEQQDNAQYVDSQQDRIITAKKFAVPGGGGQHDQSCQQATEQGNKRSPKQYPVA